MYHYRQNPLFDQNLTVLDHLMAMQAIQEFHDNYKLSDCRQLLWNLLDTALTTENSYFTDDAFHRAEIMTFVQSVEDLIEVFHFLYPPTPVSK
jgi:hypothetical protein